MIRESNQLDLCPIVTQNPTTISRTIFIQLSMNSKHTFISEALNSYDFQPESLKGVKSLIKLSHDPSCRVRNRKLKFLKYAYLKYDVSL